MTESQLREKYVAVMRGWIGLKRSDRSHKPIIDTYHKISPLPRGVRMDYNAAWCAATVSAAAFVADLLDIIPAECSCSAMIALLKEREAWQEKDDYIPRPGDLIFYDWQDGKNYASTDNKNAPDHVGVVEIVRDGMITVIEGNMGSSYVGRRHIKVNGKYIRGFGIPDYARKAKIITMAAALPKVPIAITAQQAIDGLWSNGEERKARLTAAGYTLEEIREIQHIVNHLSSGGWTVQVCGVTSFLNIRSGPGKEYGTTGSLNNGKIVTITEVHPGNGAESGWGKLNNGSGWASLDYMETV